MPSVSNYTKVDSKNSRRCIIEVDDPKSDNACLKGVFKYSLFLLCWVAVGFFLYCITLVVRENCPVYDLNDEWQVYKATYGKNYSQQEDDIRMQIFLARKNEINHHNELFIMGIVSYEKEINMFTDLTMEELEGVKCFLGQPGSVLADAYIARDDQYLPESVDWSTRGAVTGVKNQGMCGSCWAFSTTGSLEAQWFLKTGKLVSLSEQNLVDCSEPQGTFGCKGGFMTNAFDYILQNNGIDTEESYPYEGVEGECRFKRDGVGATIQGYRSVSPLEANLQAAVANIGPVSVAIDATPSFMQYRGGIFYDKSCNQVQLNHAVLVVGYGSTEGHDYWLVKNSWGPAWGESGYIRMARNMDNNCGIATMASYPLV